MGNYIGEGVRQNTPCVMVIMTNGHQGEQRLEWPLNTPFTVYFLKTTDDCSWINNDIHYIEYWDGAQWQPLNSAYIKGGYGWVWSSWTFGSWTHSYWMRSHWGDYYQIFKIGNPIGQPCPKNSTINFEVNTSDPNISIKDVLIVIKSEAMVSEGLSGFTDEAGKLSFSPICEGVWNYTASKVGVKSLSGNVFTSGSITKILTLIKATSTDSATIGDITAAVSNEKYERELKDAQETIERQNADNTLSNSINTEKTERKAETAGIMAMITGFTTSITELSSKVSDILGFLSKLDSIIDAKIEGIKDKIVGWVIDAFIDILEKVLNKEVK